MKSLAMDADDVVSHDGQLVPLKVYIPDLLLQKNLQFHKEDLIWDVKEQIIDSLPKELKERFNYGLFCPPINGKAGKFLDEYRPLADYPFTDAPGYIELRYKRRVYKMMNLEEKQIKQMHTRANLRRMLDYVSNGQVEKITKMCSRGMDPNFHCPETGETPLTTAGSLKNPAKVILGLVNGGALLDFRTKDGHTALHRAVQKNNLEALRTLLDLGASPNYKDARGLTPLYYTLLHSSEPQLTELLLHDHAFIGTCDPQGWQEVHQACKHGLVQHLEHLLFYGADMNARNASGNTPLHVCAVNDQESCARVLLFRGAEKNALNFANQSPYQVAVIANNLALADIIKNHSDDEVVPYREPPRYNPRRRASMAPVPTLSRTHSDPRLELGLTGMTMMMMMKPPSPCPSNCSLPPFSSISCISEASSTGSSTTATTCTTHTSSEDTDGSFITEKSVTSDSSGVCTSHSGASYDERRPEEDGREDGESGGILSPGTVCVCTQDYYVGLPGHLRLTVGDSLEVIGETEEEGLLEGRAADGQEGFFPNFVVQEADANLLKPRVEGRRELNARKVNTIPRRWKMFGEPRTVVLHKGKRGFGFVLRGAKATSPLMERQPSEFWPSLQYLDDVDKGGIADQAGLKKGDFLLEINGHDVSQASHELVVSIIRQSGDLVAMTVITVQGQPALECSTSSAMQRQCATLPRKLIAKKAPVPPKRDPRTTLTVGRVRARSMLAGLAEIEALDQSLCDYDSEGRSTKSSSVESIPNKRANHTLDGKSPKIASIRARPSSQRIPASELERFFQRQGSARRPRSYSTLCERKSGNGTKQPKVYGSVAAMKRSKASRTKLSDIVSNIHKEFHSTPDLNNEVTDIDEVSTCEIDLQKKSLSQEDFLNIRNSRHSWACATSNYGGSLEIIESKSVNEVYYRESWKSIEDVYHTDVPTIIKTGASSEIYAQTLPLKRSEKSHQRVSCPPPSHPPPPPPMGQVVQVDVSQSLSEYANITVANDENEDNVMSSFRPGDSAKLYASPEVVMNVGYKSDQVSSRKTMSQPRRAGGGSSLRSQSLPPKIPNGPIMNRSTTSSEAENSGDSSALYSTFKKPNRQRDSLSSDSGHVSDRGTLKSLKGKQSVTSGYASKFDIEDSDIGSPQNYPTVRAPGHEPFIPEPDYETSEDDEIMTSIDQGVVLSTFGKGEESLSATPVQPPPKTPTRTPTPSVNESQPEVKTPSSPHTEAKRAIQEARERLRFSHKPTDKNATVVFISGKITERKVEKSEIQLHRTEEGRLTGTVVISTTSEPQEPLYLSSPVVGTDDKDTDGPSRYPRRDAPASEYAKYRQQILSGLIRGTSAENMDGNFEMEGDERQPETVASNEKETSGYVDIVREDVIKAPTEFRIALTGSQKLSPVTSNNTMEPDYIIIPYRKEIVCEEVAENISSLVPSGVETQNDELPLASSSTEGGNKAIIEQVVLEEKIPPELMLIQEIEKSFKNQKSRIAEKLRAEKPKLPEPEKIECKSEQIEQNTGKNDHKEENMEYKTEKIEHTQENMEYKTEKIEHIQEIMEYKTEKIEHTQENMENKTERIEHKAEKIIYKPDIVTHKTEKIIHKPDIVTHKTQKIIHKPDIVTHKTEKIIHKPDIVTHKTEKMIHKAEELEHTAEKLEHTTEKFEHTSDKLEHKADTLQHQADEVEHKPEPIERKPQQIKHKTENVQHKTEILERQLEMFQRTPEKIELMPGRIEHQQRRIEHQQGKIEHQKERIEHKQELIEHKQELIEHLLARTEHQQRRAEHHGRTEHQHGRAEHQHGRAEHQHGRAEHQHGRAEHQHGRAEHQHSRAEHQHGRAEHQHGRTEHQRVRPEHQPGRIEHQQGRMEHQQGRMEHQQGRMEHQQGRTEYQQGRTEHQQGRIEHQQERIEHQQGRIEHQHGRTEHQQKKIERQPEKIVSPVREEVYVKRIQNVRSVENITDVQSEKTIERKKHVQATKDKERPLSASAADRTLEESMEVLRLQVNSLGSAAVNEVDVFTQLVPPPPEFATASEFGSSSRRQAPYTSETPSMPIPIAPPPEFSDFHQSRTQERRHTTGGRQLAASSSSQRSSSSSTKGVRLPCQGSSRLSGSPVDLALLASLCAKSGSEFCRVGKRTDRCTVQPSRTMTSRHIRDSGGTGSQIKTVQKEFRFKLLQSWTTSDIADWLDSLFLSEYKHRFAEAGITGAKLANMDSNDLMGLGVKQMGHRLNMERSLKRYLR